MDKSQENRISFQLDARAKAVDFLIVKHPDVYTGAIRTCALLVSFTRNRMAGNYLATLRACVEVIRNILHLKGGLRLYRKISNRLTN